MNKNIAQLLVTIGVIAYLLVLVLQFFSFWSNVGFMFFPWIALLAQIALGLPVLMYLGGKFELPLVEYTKLLAGLVSVLAISGYLGIPESAAGFGASVASDQYDSALLGVREDLGDYEVLSLQLDLAKATSDDARKKIGEEIAKYRDRKHLSDDEKKELEQDAAIYRAKKGLKEWGEGIRRQNLRSAYLDNGLIVIAAFLMLAGAMFAKKEEEAKTEG